MYQPSVESRTKEDTYNSLGIQVSVGWVFKSNRSALGNVDNLELDQSLIDSQTMCAVSAINPKISLSHKSIRIK